MKYFIYNSIFKKYFMIPKKYVKIFHYQNNYFSAISDMYMFPLLVVDCKRRSHSAK